jgi:hypothetical protein
MERGEQEDAISDVAAAACPDLERAETPPRVFIGCCGRAIRSEGCRYTTPISPVFVRLV